MQDLISLTEKERFTMAANSRTQGANARQINWEEAERKSPQRTGSWLPLDTLDEDDPIFAGTPQLRAMPTSGNVAVPQPRRQQEVAPTKANQTRAATTAQTQAKPGPLEAVVSTGAVA